MYYINNNIYSVNRYDMSRFIEFDTDNFCILDSYLCLQIKELPYTGAITVTTQEYRPDLVSYDIYGHTQYWWLLMLYNDYVSPLELTAGALVLYPSLDSLENIYFTLSTRQKTKKEEV